MCAACARSSSHRNHHRRDLRRRLQFERALLRHHVRRSRDDTDGVSCRGRRHGDPLRRWPMLARIDSGRGHREGRVRDPARRGCQGLGPGFPGHLSESAADRRRCGVRGVDRQGRRVRRSAGAVSICCSTCAAPPSSRACGRRCAQSQPVRRRPTPRSPIASAGRLPYARWRKRARRTRLRSRSRAIVSSVATARCPAAAGALSANVHCSSARGRGDRLHRSRPCRRRASPVGDNHRTCRRAGLEGGRGSAERSWLRFGRRAAHRQRMQSRVEVVPLEQGRAEGFSHGVGGTACEQACMRRRGRCVRVVSLMAGRHLDRRLTDLGLIAGGGRREDALPSGASKAPR
jgi:hypothetical protein